MDKDAVAYAKNNTLCDADAYVPKKSGKKMFEEFCREAYKNRKQNIDDADMRNIFNAAQRVLNKTRSRPGDPS
jgi:hypothetical protein